MGWQVRFIGLKATGRSNLMGLHVQELGRDRTVGLRQVRGGNSWMRPVFLSGSAGPASILKACASGGPARPGSKAGLHVI